MFQQAEWGQDVPKSNLKFDKKVQKQKSFKNGETTMHSKGFKSVLSPNPSAEKAGVRKKKFKKTSRSLSIKREISVDCKKTHNNAKGDFVQNPALLSYLSASGIANQKHSKTKLQVKPFKMDTIVEKVFTNSKAVDTNQLPKKRGGTKLKEGEREMVASERKVQNHVDKDSNYDTDKLDALYLDLRKAKMNQARKEDQEALFNLKGNKPTKIVKCLSPYKLKKELLHKEKLKKVLEAGNQRSSIRPKSTLRQKMMDKLKAAQFRYLNEKLYTSTGSEAQQLFSADPHAFDTYHEGYQQQLRKWPINPLNIIIKKIMKLPKSMTIADMGCGEAVLAKRVPHSVKSFDLIARAPGVEACDMAHTGLPPGSVDVAVYCLSLMGTDLTSYLVEANRILSTDGLLLIAEVESRFDDVECFARDVQKLGFKLIKINKSYKVFYFLEFKKTNSLAKKSKRPKISLKPCLYKRR